MPSLEESLKADRSNYHTVEAPTNNVLHPGNDLQPVYNAYIRCPLPPINATPDSLRTFYAGSQVPQFRVIPPNNSFVGGNATTNENVLVNSSSGGSGSTTVVSGLSKLQSVSIVTPVISPNQVYQGTVQISKSFLLNQLSTSQASRVELYSTKAAQVLDLARPATTAPANTAQGLLSDMYIDTAPYKMEYTNVTAMNNDPTQTPTIYVSVTNISQAAAAIAVVFKYIALEQ